jgi:uncharacterized protein YbdZ (MbtH family)
LQRNVCTVGWFLQQWSLWPCSADILSAWAMVAAQGRYRTVWEFLLVWLGSGEWIDSGWGR